MKVTASLLLVDDDAAFRQVMAGELKRLGHTVASASTGAEAIQKCEEFEPDVMLLDLACRAWTASMC